MRQVYRALDVRDSRTGSGHGILLLMVGLAILLASAGSSLFSDQGLTPLVKPRYIIYYNSNASPLSAAVDADYTHVITSFVRIKTTENGELKLVPPEHMTGQWGDIADLKKAGKKVMISYGGGEATSAEYSPLVNREEEVAGILAKFVRDHDLDGIDIDFEASDMLQEEVPAGVGDGRGFLIRLTQALRARLPSPRYSISHAPEPPYLDTSWHGGPYLDILKKTEKDIDWITVTYYNNPGFNQGIVGQSKGHTGTSYAHLTDPRGRLAWSARRVVVGKPVYTADAESGFISPDELVKTIITPLVTKYGNQFGGLAGWQFSTETDDHQAWNHEVGKSLITPPAP